MQTEHNQENYDYNQTHHERVEDVIKSDHDKIEKKLDEIINNEELSTNDKRNLFNEVKSELMGHMTAEEECFYELIESIKGVHEGQMNESIEEHHQVKLIMGELDDVAVEDPRWIAKIRVLKEDLEHHHREEEEEFLSETKDEWSDEKSEEIATRFLKIKRQVSL